MEHRMKLRIALISLMSVLLYLTCNTYQPPNVLEYSIDAAWPEASPLIFKSYSFKVIAGENKFSHLRMYADQPGFIDTAMLNSQLTSGTTVAGYFLKPGACKIYIEGTAPDQRTFKDSNSFTVRNPYSITGPAQLAIGETGSFRLVPGDTLAASGLKLRVDWKVNDSTPSPLDTALPFVYAPIKAGTQKIAAIITDSVNHHSFAADTLDLTVPGHRPAIDTVSFVKSHLTAGDTLSFDLRVSDRDSSGLKVIVATTSNGLTRIDTIALSSPLSRDSLFTLKKPFIDTGSHLVTITVIDPSGLVSRTVTDTFSVVCNPPVVNFVPDTSVMLVPFNYNTTLFVSGSADIYHWSVDGSDTTTIPSQLTRNFLSAANLKDSATVVVYGIDRYGYHGKPDTIVLRKETSFYSLSFSHIPGDSAYRDSAFWEVKTPNADRARANSAKFYWSLIRLDVGDTIYRDSAASVNDSLSSLSIKGLTIPGIALDSIDIRVSVVLKDAGDLLHTSSVLTNKCKIRLFRPRLQFVALLPGPDSVSTDIPATIKFKASDVNAGGSIASIFWKYSDTALVRTLPSTDTMLTFTWKNAGNRAIYIWAVDNDGQVSDTLRTLIRVVKNQPRIAGVSLRPATTYTNEACTLSVAVVRGYSGAKIDSIRWSCPSSLGATAATTTQGTIFPVSFAAPGWHGFTVTVYDSLHDSASRVDSIMIASGKPTIAIQWIAPYPDSIAAKVPVIFGYVVSTARNGTIDTIFWKQTTGAGVVSALPVSADSTIRNTWTDTGSVTVKIWAKDNVKNLSDTVTRSFRIVKSRPRISGITLKPLTVVTNQPCSLMVTAARGYSGAKIDSIRWSCPSSSLVLTGGTTLGNTFPALFISPGWKRVTVTLYDSLHDSSSRVDSVNIIGGKPTVTLVSILPRGDSLSTRVPAVFKYAVTTPGSGAVDSLFWQQVGLTAVNELKVAGSDSTIRTAWQESGPVTLKIWVRDNVDNQSDTLTKTIVIVKNRPSIGAFIVPSGAPPCKLAYNYSIVARRGFSGSRITEYHWVYPAASGTKDSMRTDSTLSLQFDTPGSKIISVYIQDSLHDTSARFIDTVTIDPGLPVVTGLTLDTSASGGTSIFINDPVKCTITAMDTNGTIAGYRAVLRNNNVPDSITVSGPTNLLSLTVPVGKEGTYTFEVFARDNDGNWSNVNPALSKTLVIHAAKPAVTSFNPPGGLWIYDTLAFTYSAKDTNNGLSLIIFDWKDGTKKDSVVLPPVKDTVLNRAISHRYLTYGVFAVDVSAMDEDNQLTTRTYNVTINQGRPRVQWLLIQDSLSNGMFVNDQMRFSVSGTDSNSANPDRYRILMKKTGTTDSSVIESAYGQASYVTFPLYASGTYLFKYYVRDSDAIWSLPDSVTKTVRLGAPYVAATKDTFFLPADYWGDTLNFSANASDTNGTIQKYVWVVSPPLDTTAHYPDTFITANGSLKVRKNSAFWLDHAHFNLDTAYTGAVWVKDDDGLVKIDTFRFFFDTLRHHDDSVHCKYGFKGASNEFEILGSSGQLDSMFLDVYNVKKGDSTACTAKIVMIFDSVSTFDDPSSTFIMKYLADTVVVAGSQKLNSILQFIDADGIWHKAYRPLSTVFDPYVSFKPNPLYFHFEISITNRAGQTTIGQVQATWPEGMVTKLNGFY
jgi:hypothetical protein